MLRHRSRAAGFGALAVLLLLPGLASAQEVPSPEEVLGYPLGEHFTDVAGIERYMRTLAEASDLVSVEEYGRSVQGRPLLQVLIASQEHRARLDEILELNRELTLPETSAQRAEEIIAGNPAVVYFSYGVHGSESSSPETALWTTWELAAGGGEVDGVLDSLVVVVDPALNPDGRDRWVNWFRESRTERPSASVQARERREPWPGARVNHYLFDLNRDWTWASQPETRSRLATWDRWNPQVHVDFHEMGYTSTYFFFPAAPPINPIFPDHVLEWGERFGEGNARAMDQAGRFYYTGQDYDLFYPGYGDSWPSLLGAIGMTYEQAGGGFGGIAIERPDGTVLTLEERAEGHWITGRATLRTAAEGKSELLRGFAELHRNVDEGLSDIVLVPGEDPHRVDALVRLLRTQGVEVERAGSDFGLSTQPHAGFDARSDFAAGTYLVRARQPRGRLAGALLAEEHHLDATFSYDISSWSLPYAYGVEAYSATGSIPDASWEAVGEVPDRSDGPPAARGTYGYLLEPHFDHMPSLLRFLEEGGRAYSMAETFALEGSEYPRGTFLLPRSTNDELESRLERSGLQARVTPIGTARADSGPDLGTRDAAPVHLPRLALLVGEGTQAASAGAHWFFLERVLDMPFDLVDVSDVSSVELADYDVIVVPGAGGGLFSVLGEGGMDRLDSWVRGGGTVVAVAGGAHALAGPLAEVELREREEELERDDELRRALRTREERELAEWEDRIPGTILEATLDPGHPLAFGAGAPPSPERMFVLSTGSAFEPAEDFESAAYFPEEVQRVSGLISDENLEQLEQSSWLVQKRVGGGSVILFADDPLFRMLWYAGHQPYVNAILLGPAF